MVFDLPYEERWTRGLAACSASTSTRLSLVLGSCLMARAGRLSRSSTTVLAFDFGLKRIGIAGGDTLTATAGPRPAASVSRAAPTGPRSSAKSARCSPDLLDRRRSV